MESEPDGPSRPLNGNANGKGKEKAASVIDFDEDGVAVGQGELNHSMPRQAHIR